MNRVRKYDSVIPLEQRQRISNRYKRITSCKDAASCANSWITRI